MTTDIERELRELFRDKAGDAPVSTLGTSGAAPQQVLRRGRRHQVVTVLGSALVAIVLAVGSFAGLRSLLRSDEDLFQTGDEYEVFERTATIEAFTVTSPSDWFLVNEWPLSMQMAVGSSSASEVCTVDPSGNEVCEPGSETSQLEPLPYGLPMIQLSNVDMGLPSIACRDGLPDAAAVVYVGLDYERALFGAKDPSIQPFPPRIGLPPEGDGPCGPGRYASFTVNGEPFFSWIGVGSAVSDEDRARVSRAFEMISADEDWEPVPPNAVTPAYVIAGGTSDAGEDWRLELRPDGDNVDLTLVGGLEEPSTEPFEVPSVPIEWLHVDPIFGAITEEAAGAEFQLLDGGPAIPGRVIPLPPSMPFEFDLFFIEGTAGLEGEVVALGLENQPTEPPPIATDRAGEVRLNGALLGQNWGARFTGAFADESACIRVTIDEPNEPLCITQLETSLAGTQPSMHLWVTNELALFAGSIPWQVVDIRFTSDDGTTPPMELQCTDGPAGWTDPDKKVCAIALPPEGSGTFGYLDGDGVVLFEEGNGWTRAGVALPTPVDPVHGGSYWAVYPWVGAADSREADDVAAVLFEQYGIEAFSGDLSCDVGAAEALGTDAPQGIGLYFETEEDARFFAWAYDEVRYGPRSPIARVTTYCLD